MNRILASCCLLALSTGAAMADFNLTVLHTNDFHDRFEAISAYDSTCDAETAAAGECFGGIGRLTTAITEARASIENSVLVDAGDQFQGSLLFTQYKGAMSAEFMPKLGYDVMAVGNHEFDNGPAAFATFLDAVDFPVLAANLDVTQEPSLAGKIAKSTVVEVGGEKIGFVGVTATDTPETSSPGKNVIFTPEIDATQAEVDALTAEGINKIIVISHVGYVADQELAAGLKDVDAIVGGHSHTLLGEMEGAAGAYPTMVGDVPVVTAYAYGKYLGVLELTFDDAGKVVMANGAPMLLDNSVAEDEAAVARVKELAAPLEELRAQVVAESATEIDGARETCRAVECQMGNLVADAMLDRLKDQGVQIAIQNGGGVRASIDAGPVTMGEVLTVLPFQNTLSTFEVTGEAVVAALENGASQLEEGAGRFAQVSGMSYTLDPSKPAGQRISEVMVAGAPIDPAATYIAVSNNYVRNGGDGFSMFVDAKNAYDFGPDLADVLAEYLAKNAPYTAYTDGRIKVVGQ